MKKKKVLITMSEDVLEWVDEVAEGMDMPRSEFIEFVLSGGRDAKELLDKIVDKVFDQRKAEMKAKLEIPAMYSRRR